MRANFINVFVFVSISVYGCRFVNPLRIAANRFEFRYLPNRWKLLQLRLYYGLVRLPCCVRSSSPLQLIRTIFLKSACLSQVPDVSFLHRTTVEDSVIAIRLSPWQCAAHIVFLQLKTVNLLNMVHFEAQSLHLRLGLMHPVNRLHPFQCI
jgi:hypothetical protein